MADQENTINITLRRRSEKIINKVQKINTIRKVTKAHIHTNKIRTPRIKKTTSKVRRCKSLDNSQFNNSQEMITMYYEESEAIVSDNPIPALKSMKKRKGVSRKNNNKETKQEENVNRSIRKRKPKLNKSLSTNNLSAAIQTLTPETPQRKIFKSKKKSSTLLLKNTTKLPFTPSNVDNIQDKHFDSSNLNLSLDYVSPSNNQNIIVHSNSIDFSNSYPSSSLTSSPKNFEKSFSFNHFNTTTSSSNPFFAQCGVSDNTSSPFISHNENNKDDKELMTSLSTNFEEFKKQFQKFNEISSSHNIIFSATEPNKIVPKCQDKTNEYDAVPDDLVTTDTLPHNTTSESYNMLSESPPIMSSDTGLATSMESFQLLSSDPVEPEDNFWLIAPNSLKSFGSDDSLKTPPLYPSQSNPINKISDNYFSSLFYGKSSNSSNPFINCHNNNNNNNNNKEIVNNNFNNSSNNIFLNYDKSKKEGKSKEFNKLIKSESVLLTEDTSNLRINTDNESSSPNIEQGKPGLYIVGGNEDMYLGLGDKISEVSHFTYIKGLKEIDYIATGEDYCMAIQSVKDPKSNDKNYLWSFGNNSTGVLGHNGVETTPHRIEFFNTIKIVQISCGSDICVFRSIDGKLYITGTYSNDEGNLIKTELPVLLDKFKEKIIDIAVSKGYIYGISEHNEILYWNYNKNISYAKLLYTKEEDVQEVTKYEVLNENEKVKFTRVFSGKYHAFLLDQQKRVWAFGSNQWGQLGINSDIDSEEPTIVEELNGISIEQIACGNFHTLFRTESGEVFVCGKNDRYQLGFNSGTGSILHPKKLENIKFCIHTVCGSNHSFAIVNEEFFKLKSQTENNTKDSKPKLSTSVLYGWGDGESYGLGTGYNISKNLIKRIDLRVNYAANKFFRPRRVSMQIKTVEAGKGFTLLLTK